LAKRWRQKDGAGNLTGGNRENGGLLTKKWGQKDEALISILLY
jgi:hypothetical protein